MRYFPLFLDLTGKPVLLVGGGAVAARKFGLLAEAHAVITVVAPSLGAELAGALARQEFTHHAREFAATDIDGQWLVVAATDPGIPNWLDTEGRAEGLVSYRWAWAETAPLPASRRIALADLRKHIPASTPPFTAEARRQQIARRRLALARRFRR